MKKQLILCAGFLALWSPATAWPDDQTSTNALTRWATQEYLLGDWGGLRRDLARRGAVFEFFYIGSEPDNLAGGLNTGAIYQGLALATLDLDARMALPGIQARRAPLLPIGAVVFSTLVEQLGLRGLVVSEWGLREGAVLDSLSLPAVAR